MTAETKCPRCGGRLVHYADCPATHCAQCHSNWEDASETESNDLRFRLAEVEKERDAAIKAGDNIAALLNEVRWKQDEAERERDALAAANRVLWSAAALARRAASSNYPYVGESAKMVQLAEVRRLLDPVVDNPELRRMAGEASVRSPNACTCDDCLKRMAGESTNSTDAGKEPTDGNAHQE